MNLDDSQSSYPTLRSTGRIYSFAFSHPHHLKPRQHMAAFRTPVTCASQACVNAGQVGRWTEMHIRRLPMFEQNNSEVESLMKENASFRRLYNQHQQLDRQVVDAEAGKAPMAEIELHQLKKKKLWAKDQMARMLNDYMATMH
ncbi:MAG: YdcH family protein [Xanthomonadales bacterium]|jgi:uncharacterized protein YdcH (DUF465 family)|nr:YdcH family protein [Xanthomonadales bacterium]